MLGGYLGITRGLIVAVLPVLSTCVQHRRPYPEPSSVLGHALGQHLRLSQAPAVYAVLPTAVLVKSRRAVEVRLATLTLVAVTCQFHLSPPVGKKGGKFLGGPHRLWCGVGGKGSRSGRVVGRGSPAHMLARIGKPGCQQPDTPRLPCFVQNPYVRMLVGQIDLNGLQRAGRLGGYPCLDQPVIVACRPLLTRGGGIQSSGICLQLPDACHQDAGAGLDPLGCVQRQQGVEAVLDLLGADAVSQQLFDFAVVQNSIQV